MSTRTRRLHVPSAKRFREASSAVVPSSRARTTTVPRQVRNAGTGFPKLLTIKHRYVDGNLTLTAGAGLMGNAVFSANGMFDPNITFAGHQPLYFDQMAPLYNHYTVISSKFKVTVTSDTALGTTRPFTHVGVYVAPSAIGIPTNIDTVAEQPGSISKVNRSGGPVTILQKSWNARQAFGGNTMDNDELQGTSAANPAEQQYFVLFFQGQQVATTEIFVVIEIEYTAVWDELRTVAGS